MEKDVTKNKKHKKKKKQKIWIRQKPAMYNNI